jgi:tRNA (cytosine34-C5)-methyltransferase
VDCASDDERQAERLAWRRTLGEILPASFRIGKDIPSFHQTKLTQELETLLQSAAAYVPPPPSAATDETSRVTCCDPRAGPLAQEAVVKLQRLSFLPHAYQMGLDRATIRKNPALEPLHAWLKQQVASGAVTRQETVSMVPPILLNVVPTDHVLDMCAAPGSKTSQLLEDLSCNSVAAQQLPTDDPANGTANGTATEPNSNGGAAAGGVLVANDASAARAYMLVHQLRRILHHHPVALITACPAQFFASGILQFDKILCDVPCTGDGTTRKNIGIWKTWSATGALALHVLQLSIALKGAAQLLKVGGLMVYSTCSFNPVENEAVVAELLRQSNGALELVDYGAVKI